MFIIRNIYIYITYIPDLWRSYKKKNQTRCVVIEAACMEKMGQRFNRDRENGILNYDKLDMQKSHEIAKELSQEYACIQQS